MLILLDKQAIDKLRSGDTERNSDECEINKFKLLTHILTIMRENLTIL